MSLIGLDTNILLRALLDDDVDQSAHARGFLAGLTREEPGYVGVPVMLELFWALRTRYRLPKGELTAMIFELLEIESLMFEDFEAIVSCLHQARDDGVDFSDALIARRNADRGCRTTVTFDQKAAKSVSAMTLLP